MRSVGIKILKNKLSYYVSLVEKGERILVTDHDRVVAQLSLPDPVRSHELSDVLVADAIRSGYLTPALNQIGRPEMTRPKTEADSLSFDDVMAALDESRADRSRLSDPPVA